MGNKRIAEILGISVEDYEEKLSSGNRYCKIHGLLDAVEFSIVTSRGYPCYRCRRCINEKSKRWKSKNKDRVLESQKKCRDKYKDNYNYTRNKKRLDTKIEVYSHYCDGYLSCAICGEPNVKFLCLDHINGGGRKHRNKDPRKVFLQLKKDGYPDGYRVLCHNCNLKYGCRDCFIGGIPKPESELLQTKRAISNRRYWNGHKEEINSKCKERAKINRNEVIDHYGGKCACCGVSDVDVLSFDHINGGGTQHCKEIKLQGKNFSYRWLKSEGYPDGYQVLCMNCNQAKGIYGTCPHKS